MNKKQFLKVTAYAAVFGLVSGCAFEGVNYAVGGFNNDTAVVSETKTSETIPEVKTVSSSSSSSDGVSDVAEELFPSIVAIDVEMNSTVSDIFGQQYTQKSKGSGSGFIVGEDDDNLYIATNNHVVKDTTSVKVKFNDGESYDATVKGADSDIDVAVVFVPKDSIKETTLDNIKVAKLGDSDEIKVGEEAIAIGNSLGYGTSVTVGIVSAKDREYAGDDFNITLIQTDAAINPGNSGGPLINSKGEVIGINSAKYVDSEIEGMGFSIPISTAVPVIKEIVEAKEVSEGDRAYLGIVGNYTDNEESALDIPSGIYINEVVSSSPAEKAGILRGDIIVKVDDTEISSYESLKEKLLRKTSGDTVTITVKRLDGNEYVEKEIKVTLGKKSDYASNDQQNNQDGQDNEDRSKDDENGNSYNDNYGSGFGLFPFG